MLQSGKNQLKVFGNTYPTPDGTCVRDYIHINDLGAAHLLAGVYIEANEGAFTFNLGNGSGFSVLDVINAAQKVVGQDISYSIETEVVVLVVLVQ